MGCGNTPNRRLKITEAPLRDHCRDLARDAATRIRLIHDQQAPGRAELSRMSSSSRGEVVRGSMTVTSTPFSANAAAASRAK